MQTSPEYDVVAVGGGAAGLSGALALGRARRTVLVVDAGEPRNAAAGHVHNYLGREGTPPAELLEVGRAEVAAYGVQVRRGRVTTAMRSATGFGLALDDGTTVHARRLLVTTGLTDVLPEIAGLAERFGNDVLHCPYCHGWEVRDRAIGIVAGNAFALHGAGLWRQWSDDVTLFLNDRLALSPEDAERLAARGVAVVEGRVTEVVVEDDRLVGVRLESGEVVRREAVVAAPQFVANSDLLASLGLEPVAVEMGGVRFGYAVPSDPGGATTVPGVWLAGNVTDLRAQVISAAAGGLNAGAMINMDLIEEETAAAVATYRRKSA
ncbi:NAD(P)/FAD-dependent oxidoreductase [Nocardioides sp. URHA0020]|uniref:NAD(P)/FAD-dependent oxidoreductase n=1 Tax=Nocardioides sp. URHA0020 TaxID=1380392 RepID=UPI00048EAD2F|nr:NAD(P)/FAD-dependent oxidoreductase [Nocardioides sp. URHA0020]